jgi:hypothetical protein
LYKILDNKTPAKETTAQKKIFQNMLTYFFSIYSNRELPRSGLRTFHFCTVQGTAKPNSKSPMAYLCSYILERLGIFGKLLTLLQWRAWDNFKDRLRSAHQFCRLSLALYQNNITINLKEKASGRLHLLSPKG